MEQKSQRVLVVNLETKLDGEVRTSEVEEMLDAIADAAIENSPAGVGLGIVYSVTWDITNKFL